VVDNANAIHISYVVMDYTVAIDHALPSSEGLVPTRLCPALNYLFGCGTSELLSMCLAYHAKATIVAMQMRDLCVYLQHMPSFGLHIPAYAPFPNRRAEKTFGASLVFWCGHPYILAFKLN